MRCLLAASVLLVSACAATMPVAPDGGPPRVTFELHLPPTAFGPDRPITVHLYDAAMLAQEDQNDRCDYSHIDFAATDPAKQVPSCPPGVTYAVPVPEAFTFQPADLARPVVVTSQNIRIGERYRVGVDGFSGPERCEEEGGGSLDGTASTQRVVLDDIPVLYNDSGGCLISNEAGGLISNNAGGLTSNNAGRPSSPPVGNASPGVGAPGASAAASPDAAATSAR